MALPNPKPDPQCHGVGSRAWLPWSKIQFAVTLVNRLRGQASLCRDAGEPSSSKRSPRPGGPGHDHCQPRYHGVPADGRQSSNQADLGKPRLASYQLRCLIGGKNRFAAFHSLADGLLSFKHFPNVFVQMLIHYVWAGPRHPIGEHTMIDRHPYFCVHWNGVPCLCRS